MTRLTASRQTSRRRRVLQYGGLGALLVAGLTLWLARDLPRWVVAAALSDQLAADVRLERLEIRDARRFVLFGLEIERFRDYPFIEHLEIGQLEIESPIQDILENRFERIRLRGVEAVLAPARHVEPPDRPAVVLIGELILEPAVLRIAGEPDRDESRLVVEATARGIGTRTTGEVRVRSDDLAIEPLFAVFDSSRPSPLRGQLRDFEADLRLGLQGSHGRRIEARAAGASLSAGGRDFELTEPRLAADLGDASDTFTFAAARAVLADAGGATSVDAPRFEMSVTPAEGDETQRFEIVPDLTWLESGRLEGDWDPANKRLLRLEGRLQGLDLAQIFPASGLDATAEVVIRDDGDRLAYSIEAVPSRLRLAPGRELEAGGGAMIHINGSLPFESIAALESPVWQGPIEATLILPTGRILWNSTELPPSLFPLEGHFDGDWKGHGPVRFEGTYRLETASAGRFTADGEFGGDARRADLTWSWTDARLENLAELLGAPASRRHLSLRGTAEATGTLRGPLSQPLLAGDLRLQDVEVAAPPWGFTGEAEAAWSWDEVDSSVHWRSFAANGLAELPALGSQPVTLTASGWSGLDGSRGRLDEAILESPGLGTARFAGDWRRRADRRIAATGDLVLEGLDLARWQRAAKPLVENEALADFALEGMAGAELAVSLDSAGTWQLEGPVHLASAGFTSADGSRVLEGLAGRWELTAGGAASSPVEARAAGRAGGFLLLWNTFFGDFSDAEAALAASGRMEPPTAGGPGSWRLEASATMPEGPIAEARLESPSGPGGALRYSFSLEDRDLAATHARYLSPLLEDQLGRLELGGALSARGRGNYRRAEGQESAAWELIGDLTLTRFRLASGGGQAEVDGLDLELPLDLRRRPTAAPVSGRASGATLSGRASGATRFTGPRLSGRLAFERLALRGLELPPTETDLLVEADSVGLEQQVVLDLLGGTLTLERLTLRQLLSPGRHLEAGIELSDIRLERVAEELDLFPLEGALNGHLPVARLSPDRLRVEGGGRFEVFGGTVDVRDISGEDVLTRFPKLQLSADFQDIDLGALTRRIDFGEMTGVLAGSLEDCELFRGVPVRFTAELVTVERQGVPRTVDVKAINNLTILGTGQGTNIFDRGIKSFLKRYNYAALGVSMRLDDDVLLLHGLEHRGGKELFLRGRLPFRIDVVNAQPGKTVSFQTMVRRLKSLDFDRAAKEP